MSIRAVGSSRSRYGARDKVLGRTRYPGDIDMAGQAWMKVRFAGQPHARIRTLDVSKARAHPGVIAVLTAEDVPCNEYGLIYFDQPVLCGEVVRCEGDQVALVIAESEQAASEGRDLIEVDYEPLPIISSAEAAMRPDAFLLHPERGDSNILAHYKTRYGDAPIEEIFDDCDVIVEGVYRTGMQEHAYLQPEAGLGYIDESTGQIVVNVAGQWMHEDRIQIAHALGMPEAQIRVEYSAIGGAFGGREDMSIQIILALAAWKVGRPVKIIWSRHESIIGHHKRHAYTIRTKWGASWSGRLIAAWAECIQDAGAYAYTSSKVLGNSHLTVTGPYEWEAVHVDSYSVYTNNVPGGAFRGFGGPQGHFAAETQMNKLAERLEMDPVKLRLKNVLRDGSQLPTRATMPPGVSMGPVIEAAARAAKWTRQGNDWQRPATISDAATRGDHATATLRALPGHRRRGVGFAAAFKNVGFSFAAPEENWATIELHGGGEIERVVVKAVGADVGQGAHSVFRQMAAEAVGVPLERVELQAAHTDLVGSSGSASASRMTFMAGNALIGAARLASRRWEDEIRPATATFGYRPRVTTELNYETGESDPNISYGYVAEAVELEVDLDTGQIELLHVLCADDVGRAINPRLVEGQIEGGVVQAAGYALMENLVTEEGRIKTPYFSNYLIPTIYDIPRRTESLILEYPDPFGPFGARGMAEMPFIPLAPAIVAALHDATGIWFDQIPLTPDRLLEAFKRSSVRAFERKA
ncbi:MAG: molybdopterin-dependent oxidoreductase [Anaerolineales bacterium]|nr:molybdopterin-dependent oxidoreductase [Anaerolineales bacterium]MCB9128641.1 molybdopterin-dependent oxidoreductase [Ardenticatenales bacterium]MCB9172873.1 molybdopterin-dependent oxidoreductase [Ardenticatenales bacterium]